MQSPFTEHPEFQEEDPDPGSVSRSSLFSSLEAHRNIFDRKAFAFTQYNAQVSP
jgi:hypothetical protein